MTSRHAKNRATGATSFRIVKLSTARLLFGGRLLCDESYQVSDRFYEAIMWIRFRVIKQMARSYSYLSDKVRLKVKHYVIWVDAQILNKSVSLVKGKTPTVKHNVWSQCIPGCPHYPRIKRL
jgi:hypothetical protein